jgi:hypothetical protein
MGYIVYLIGRPCPVPPNGVLEYVEIVKKKVSFTINFCGHMINMHRSVTILQGN